jgi:pimeloyl-ACP methyl ester carboxylesterase
MSRHHVIDTIHGIHTDADRWPHVLESWFAAHYGDQITVNSIDWGFFRAVQMYLYRLMPFWFRGRVHLIAEALRETNAIGWPQSIVAHSFGTYLAVETLWKHPAIEVETFVAIAGVLDNRWHGSKLARLVQRGQVKRVLVFWSTNDTVIRDFCLWPYGKLGATGFVDVPRTTPYLRQLATSEQHSTYFWHEFRNLYFREIADFILGEARA